MFRVTGKMNLMQALIGVEKKSLVHLSPVFIKAYCNVAPLQIFC